MGAEQPVDAAAGERIHDHHLRRRGVLFSRRHGNIPGIGIDLGQRIGQGIGVAADFRATAVGLEFAGARNRHLNQARRHRRKQCHQDAGQWIGRASFGITPAKEHGEVGQR